VQHVTGVVFRLPCDGASGTRRPVRGRGGQGLPLQPRGRRRRDEEDRKSHALILIGVKTSAGS
jgi:hypothetical protein